MTMHSLETLCLAIVDCPHSTPVWTDSGVLVLRSPNIRNGRLDLSEQSFTDESHFAERIRRAEPRGGDLVITREAPMGEVAMIPAGLRCCLGQRMVLLRPDPERVVSRYLLFALQSTYVRSQIMWAEGTGSTVSNLRIPDLKRLNVPLPDREAQEAIAEALGALDDKIELNRRMSQTLEAMAKAIFEAWFLDFEHEWSIHEWERKPLDAVADFLNGLALQKYPAVEKEASLPVIKIAQLRAGHTRNADRASTGVPDPYVINDGDLLFSWSGSLEVDFWCGGRGALNQHLFKVTSKIAPPWFAYLWTKHHLPEFRGIAANKATTMGHIQRKHLTAAEVLLPPPAVLDAMDKVMQPLVAQMIQLRLEAQTLAELRQQLLPRLLSGELVPSARDEPETAMIPAAASA